MFKKKREMAKILNYHENNISINHEEAVIENFRVWLMLMRHNPSLVKCAEQVGNPSHAACAWSETL